jgi:hypothetical protein
VIRLRALLITAALWFAAGPAMAQTIIDDSAFAPNATRVTPIAGEVDDTSSDAVTENNAGALRMTTARSLHVTLRDSVGDSAMDDANNALRVNIIAGAGSGGTALADESGFTLGTTQITPMGCIEATDSSPANSIAAVKCGSDRELDVDADTELPAAAALTDNFANPTVPGVGAFMMGWDGATWDRLPGTSAAGLSVTCLSGCSGGAQYTEGDTDASITGTAMMFETDTGTNALGVVNSSNPLPVDVISFSPTVVVRGEYAFDAALTGFNVAVAGRGSTAIPTAVSAEDDDTYFWLSRNGALNTIIRDSTGDSAMDDANNALRINCITGCSGGTQFAEDAGHSSGAVGTLALAVRNDAAANSTTDANGDYAAIAVDVKGRIFTDSSLINGNIILEGAGVSSAGVQRVSVAADAHDAAVTERPIRISGRAQATVPTDVSADGDNTNLWVLRSGLLPTTVRDSVGDSAMDDANNAMRVNVVAGSAGGPSKADDAAFTIATDSVAPMGALADEASTDSVDEGDVGIPRMTLDRKLLVRIVGGTDANRMDIDASGRPTVNINGTVTVSGSGTFTTQDTSSLVDNAGFTDGTSRVLPSGFIFDEAAGTALTENDVAAARIDSKRAQVAVIEDATTRGQRMAVDASGRISVLAITNSVTVDSELPTVETPADNLTNATQAPRVNALGYVFDGSTWDRFPGNSAGGAFMQGNVASDLAVTANPLLDGGRASAAAPADVSADGDAVASWHLRNGAQAIQPTFAGVLQGTGNGTAGTSTPRVTIASDNTAFTVNAAQATASSLNAEVQGDAAHDAAVSGNPVLLGGRAETPDDTAPSAEVSAEGDATDIAVDRDGAVYTHPTPPRIWHVASEVSSAVTDTTLKAAPGAGLSLYITDIYIACSAADDVTIEEGTTTMKFKYYCNGKGDGVAKSFVAPIKITANTLVSWTTSAAVNATVVLSGYTGP